MSTILVVPPSKKMATEIKISFDRAGKDIKIYQVIIPKPDQPFFAALAFRKFDILLCPTGQKTKALQDYFNRTKVPNVDTIPVILYGKQKTEYFFKQRKQYDDLNLVGYMEYEGITIPAVIKHMIFVFNRMHKEGYSQPFDALSFRKSYKITQRPTGPWRDRHGKYTKGIKRCGGGLHCIPKS